MPTYRINDPSTGRTIRLVGDSPPTEQELEEVFKSVGQQQPSSPATIADMRRREEQPKDPLNRTPTAVYVSGWITTLLATFAVSWILARRRYNLQSGGVRTTSQEAEANPASFRRASLGVRRLASTLFLLFTMGGVLMGVMAGGSDFRFTASLGLIMGLLLWVLIRGVDWIIRGFKFGG